MAVTLRRALWVFAVVVLAPALFLAGAWVHYAQVVRPRMLKSAGPVLLQPLDTDVPAETALPKAIGADNGAYFALLALASYNHRREPFLARRGLQPFVSEPPITPWELKQLSISAAQRSFDPYEEHGDHHRFTFAIVPGNKPWVWAPSSDPFEQRPYTVPLRSLAQAALNWGKQREKKGSRADAAGCYAVVARLGIGLRQGAGCLLDVELGLEIELKALHYMEKLYEERNDQRRLQPCRKYRESVERLQQEVRRKYAQLDNPEAAKQVLAHDAVALWRVEAAAALAAVSHDPRATWMEAWSSRASLGAARRDPERTVRLAVERLGKMKPEEFFPSDSEKPGGKAE